MLLSLCKSCQYCLESWYWYCCEERYCFDEKVAAYRLENEVTQPHACVDMAINFDDIVTKQPQHNDAATRQNGRIERRAIGEIPVNADKIVQVFSKSMIFCEEPELNISKNLNFLDELDTKSEPDLDRPNRTKVYFEDEINNPVTDLEIMFKDEIDEMIKDLEDNGMSKIAEEEEKEDEGGLVMNVRVKKISVVKSSNVTMKDQPKMTTVSSVYKYDPRTSLAVSTIKIPKADNVKSILRVKHLPRSHSAKNLTSIGGTDATQTRAKLTHVESLRNMESAHISRVLSKVPHRSASFLVLPCREHQPIRKTDSALAIRPSNDSEQSLVSHLPDTPVIRSINLPRFFAESPAPNEYKAETSLQSIQRRHEVVLAANDYSMPRYYGASITPPAVQESRSLPDLRAPNSALNKHSKRLITLRGKLKPLLITKGPDDKI